MRYILSILPLLLFTACFFDKEVPTKKEEPKKEIKETNITVSEEDKFLLTLDKKQKELYNNLTIYLSQLKALNTEEIVNMTYPKFFSVFSESLFRAQVSTMVNSSQINIQSFDTNITDIGKVDSFSNGYFSTVAYKSVVTVYFQNPELYNTESSLNTLYSILVRKYGIDNIYVDVKNRLITIKKDVKMLAIKENSDDWKFIGDNKEYREFYPNFLPYDILDKI